MPNGNGVLESPNGMKYKGDWVLGKVLLTSLINLEISFILLLLAPNY